MMGVALDWLAFMPFSIVMEKWVWGVRNGNILPKDYNKKWWELREKYQGVKAPVQRSEHDFDPGTFFHIVNDVEYARLVSVRG